MTLICNIDVQGRPHVFLFYGNNSNGSIKVGILSFFSETSVALKCKAARSQQWKNLFLSISEIIAIKSPFFNRILYLSLN